MSSMHDYRFDCFRLDPQTVRLYRQETPVDLEPQVFNTLLYLLENRHRVVTKDELFEQVWQGRTLTDHVITRIIYELRKTLDDKDSGQSCIRTVRGKGYQFVADVEVLNESSDHSVQTPSQPNDYKRSLIKNSSAGILIMIIIFILFQWGDSVAPLKETSHKQQKTPYQTLTILPIEVPNGNEELSILVQSLVDYLSYQLKFYFKMKVVHPDSLIGLSLDDSDIYTVQKATHADLILQGFIELNEQTDLKLHLILHQYNEGDVLVAFPLGAYEFPFPKNSHDLNALYKQRKITVRSIVDIIKPGLIIDDKDFETEDPEAYRLAIAAHDMLRTDDCEDMKKAEELLLRALERDEGFVYAYLQLFNNYYKRVWICGESTEYHLKGLQMAEKIDRLAPDKYGAIEMRRSTILVESNRVEEAYQYSQNVDWNHPASIYDESYSLRYAGFLHQSAQNIDRILQLDPFFFSDKPVLHAPNTLLYLNRFDDHIKLLADPGNSYHDYFRGLNLLLQQQTTQAVEILNGVVSRTPNDLFGLFSESLVLVIQGEHERALQTIRNIEQLRNEKKHTDGEMTYKVAQLYALNGNDQEALRLLSKAVDQGFFPMNYFMTDPAMASIVHFDAFKQVVQRATARHEAFAAQFGLKSERKE